MFCPKCGTNNPDSGKFCRKCGTDLGGVTEALSGKLPSSSHALTDRRGRPVNWDSAIRKLGMGVAFVVISFILGVTGAGRGWWFWMLLPGFMFLASGVAAIVQLQRMEKGGTGMAADDRAYLGVTPNAALPSSQTEWVAPETRYKTGDMVPPSVTDATTRHLELDSEGQTISLPKK
jgi:hypothetical protein